jgi:hypothetical protein
VAAGLQLEINISLSSLALVIDIGTLLIDIRWAANEQKVQIIRRTIPLSYVYLQFKLMSACNFC